MLPPKQQISVVSTALTQPTSEVRIAVLTTSPAGSALITSIVTVTEFASPGARVPISQVAVFVNISYVPPPDAVTSHGSVPFGS